MNSTTNLVGAATRYIVGRNAVQTVYWRTPNQNSSASQARMLKVSRTFNYGKPQESGPPLPTYSSSRSFASTNNLSFFPSVGKNVEQSTKNGEYGINKGRLLSRSGEYDGRKTRMALVVLKVGRKENVN
ncbi:hypothetical protein NQ318_017450 [Aromia moschata]|uniref:Uncharacterized protein n=1 Tax=Aromia moschata TaxID=1265417 RepID=A0AAV8Z539_9CUCU|nr:hypothetical protein NQ318_017450 [Aromia moschata]